MVRIRKSKLEKQLEKAGLDSDWVESGRIVSDLLNKAKDNPRIVIRACTGVLTTLAVCHDFTNEEFEKGVIEGLWKGFEEGKEFYELHEKTGGLI